MVATDSALRITIRIDIPDSAYPSTCIDLAVPRNSSIAEILDEVLTLADAPRISRPWQATTAAGVLIDAAQPLAHTPLTHGSTIVLSPHRDVEPPVLCDAAESFIDHGTTRQHTGLTTLSTLVGIILIMCCAMSPLTGIIPLGAKFLVVALLTLVVLTRMCSTASLFNDSPDGDSTGALAALSILCLTSVICTCLGALSFIIPFPIASSQLSAVPWAGLVTALCGATMLITCHILGTPPLRLTVACATALTVIACTSAAFALTSTPSSIAATTCVIATVLVSLSPWLSLRFAGLRVPQLPSAGQDFNVADIPIDNPEARASRATALLDGILIGTVACAIPAMIVLSLRGDGYTAALCAASAGAVLAHAMRHRSILALWSLWSWGMTSIAAIGLCLLFAGKNTPLLCIGALGALICTTAPLWAHHIKTLSPTTLNWLERFESLAVAATIPLAAHLLGIFSLIRGLG